MAFDVDKYRERLELEISMLESMVQEGQYDDWDVREYLCAKMDGLDLAWHLLDDEND